MTLIFKNSFEIQPSSESGGGGAVTAEKVLDADTIVCGETCYVNNNIAYQAICNRVVNANSSPTYDSMVCRVINASFSETTDKIVFTFLYSPFYLSGSDCGIMAISGDNYYIIFDIYGYFYRWHTNVTGSSQVFSSSVNASNFQCPVLMKISVTPKSVLWEYSTDNGKTFSTISSQTFSTTNIANIGLFRFLKSSSYICPSMVDLSTVDIDLNGQKLNILTDKETGKTYNVTPSGFLYNNNGVLTGFKTVSYATLPITFNPASASWEQQWKFKVGTFLPSYQRITGTAIDMRGGANLVIKGRGLQCWLTSNNTLWDIWSGDTEGYYTGDILTEGLWYWVRMSFDGTNTYKLSYSTDGENFTDAITVTDTKTVASIEPTMLGFGSNNNPFFGNIDLNECYIKIDGQMVWQGVQ